jgi:uroporphyrin-III C-methyltransferase/precorrin-2 dehydrogenase/sirohydrochlorin ferrochelatase
MRYLPLFLDLTRGSVALIGSGESALNKLRLLRAAQARVRWYPLRTDVAEEILQSAADQGRLEVSFDDPLTADLSGHIAVVSAAGAPIDNEIAARARSLRLPVNVVDRPELSAFIFPAIVDRGDIVVAVGTGGAAPVLARRIRERIEAALPARLGNLAALMGRFRARFIAAKGSRSPRLFWQAVVDGPIADAALAGRMSEAEARLTEAIDGGGGETVRTGTVFLVGAGPGDPDLLTLRALHVLQDADIVFHDELVTDEILDRARRDARRVFVGKRRGQPGIGQAEINRLLAQAAREGKQVVRLKSGDPFVFGRGGEELEYLRDAEIPVIVVPGITAALGCAAEVGLPLTFRNESSRLTFITAHRADAAATIDWSSLADEEATLVVYMGLASAAAVRDGLIGAGRRASTPAAVIARGTRVDSQTLVGSLDDLPELAAAIGEGPALLVVGEVVRRSQPWRAEIDALFAKLEAA